MNKFCFGGYSFPSIVQTITEKCNPLNQMALGEHNIVLYDVLNSQYPSCVVCVLDRNLHSYSVQRPL